MPRWPAKDTPRPVPATTGELCDVCPSLPLDPTTTHMSCPHGSWSFAPAQPPATEPEREGED
jgi:hypothetical protein